MFTWKLKCLKTFLSAIIDSDLLSSENVTFLSSVHLLAMTQQAKRERYKVEILKSYKVCNTIQFSKGKIFFAFLDISDHLQYLFI